ncbi:hypothetical protein TCON_2590 [Astathelohania contejeani]|uniref:Uncharacterized protein n=1 Tax=Astathelohania contejeani TaxID=164912 RepID=A0ABQ7HVK4_9MICR|nr:hypothetical protein TCON_2590 [Thelohania contejeani]
MLYNASIVVKPKSQSTIWQQVVIECWDMTIRKGIMRYLGVFNFYLRISTALKKLRSHSIQEVMENERAEIRVDTRIRTDILIKNNRPDIFIYDKKENEIILVEVGITGQDNFQIVETEKKRKYDLFTNELGLLYKTKLK